MRLYDLNVGFWHPDRRAAHFELDSDQFFEAWKARRDCHTHGGDRIRLGGTIAFALIDGAHTMEQVRKDIDNVTAILETGGHVYMHDTADDDFGCRRVLRQVLREGRYRLVMENPNALLQKKA